MVYVVCSQYVAHTRGLSCHRISGKKRINCSDNAGVNCRRVTCVIYRPYAQIVIKTTNPVRTNHMLSDRTGHKKDRRCMLSVFVEVS